MEINGKNAFDEAAVREAVESLQGKSQSELFGALSEVTKQERAAGNLSDTRMEEIYEKLAPLLTEAQRQRMRDVIARLK